MKPTHHHMRTGRLTMEQYLGSQTVGVQVGSGS